LVYPQKVASNDIAQAILASYATPWLSDREAPRGTIPEAQQKWIAGAAGIGVGALVASFAWKTAHRRGRVGG
jgi:hypothetical protein